MPIAPRALVLLIVSIAAGPAMAAKVGEVTVIGLDEAMTTNVRESLSLVDAEGEEMRGRRLGFLVREAEDETRTALEPFGYYDPQITVERVREGDTVSVTITVVPGEPVRVRRTDVAILGEGVKDRYLKEDLARFKPAVGDVLDHQAYETSKVRITRRLAERGYFDAEFVSRRVEVTRAEQAADIDLVWESGRRYDMGPITFEQAPNRIIRPGILERLVYWEQGSYYHQGKLDRLRLSLASLDYFSAIDIAPDPAAAVDGEVPVAVTLTPAKRSVYTAGLSYGTDNGFGVRLGFERRYLNDRGHKLKTQVDWAERKKAATVQYRIPAFAWLDGWYTLSAQYADEQTDYVDSRRVEFVGSRNGQINEHWDATASVHFLRERWRYDLADDGGGALAPLPDYEYGTFLYPSLRAHYIRADDRIFPRNAFSLTTVIKGAVEGVGSDASFAQLYGIARWYRGFGDNDRLIVRGEAGHTYTDEVVSLPPSLRFYAGGDGSIRGYAYQEVGPSFENDFGEYYTGAKNLATASVEYEHYFSGPWGAAVFVDTGSAFDDTPDWRTGVGIGLRWRSPVGPVRVDIAHGLDDPDSSYQFYLNIGADL
ncbi:autotransporter assembly complex protein TamA [Marilutibacter aestuarii]|uniref:Translocation and assembly module subunit TamA n=1 Tax=Marilutibacter aestuarii TaxID=1706195 RepID=A0A508AI88_9GAMM|nr:autotransporter assembly complex family protein [Lysobacter aestuarii]TQD45402.1 outer membrane protein assembly factor [Lysobacter aestuarii]